MKTANIPAMEIPNYRILEATQRGAAHNWLFYCWGGLGDRVCSEPTLRWAKNNLRKKRMMILTEEPELFAHLDDDTCQVRKIGTPDVIKPDEWYLCRTIQTPQSLVWEFFSHLLVNAVDYVSISCLRMQLPVADREIKLADFDAPFPLDENEVLVHPGRHWPSKTFPGWWWHDVCAAMVARGLRPLIVGSNIDATVGYVDFTPPKGCADWRDKLSLTRFVGLVKNCRVVVSNDSAVVHIAAAGRAWIGVVASCKHPDYIGHWRNGKWRWRFKNLEKKGLYQTYDLSPFSAQGKEISVEDIDPVFLQACLPDPGTVAAFARTACDRYT